MKDRKLFETVGEAGQIFAVGFDLTDLDDGTQGAEIRSYIEFNGITTNDAVKVIGDILGKFIHEASKKKDTRCAMVKTLIMHVMESMDEDEGKPEKPKNPEESEDDDIQKITDTLESIKTLLEVFKFVKEN